jgi:hypothetical protein
MAQKCTDLDHIRVTDTDEHLCADRVKTGSSRVHLRLCLLCYAREFAYTHQCHNAASYRVD